MWSQSKWYLYLVVSLAGSEKHRIKQSIYQKSSCQNYTCWSCCYFAMVLLWHHQSAKWTVSVFSIIFFTLLRDRYFCFWLQFFRQCTRKYLSHLWKNNSLNNNICNALQVKDRRSKRERWKSDYEPINAITIPSKVLILVALRIGPVLTDLFFLLFCKVFGSIGIVECLGSWEFLGEIWELVRFNTSTYVSVSNTFNNYQSGVILLDWVLLWTSPLWTYFLYTPCKFFHFFSMKARFLTKYIRIGLVRVNYEHNIKSGPPTPSYKILAYTKKGFSIIQVIFKF